MRPGDVQVKVGGMWLRSLGHVGSVGWSTRYGDGPCGPDLASCVVGLEPRDDTGLLRIGQTFEVYERGVLRFGGKVSGAGRGREREVQAKGWARVHWDATLSQEPGYRIGYDARDKSYTPADPSTPTWLLDASDLDIGIADDRLYTQVVATYATAVTDGQVTSTSTVTETDSAASSIYGVLPFELDLTPLLVISASTARGYARQQLAEFAIPEWTSRVTTNSTRLLTLQGLPAHLPDVKAMQKVRMFHMPATSGGLRRKAATDVILGEVEFSTDNPDEVTIAPLRVAPRNLADTVRALVEQRREAAA